VLNDFRDDRFAQAAALVSWLDRNIHYLIEKASVADHSTHPDYLGLMMVARQFIAWNASNRESVP
jgi:hypothetical protein